jgi:hypothetical protein
MGVIGVMGVNRSKQEEMGVNKSKREEMGVNGSKP